MIIIIILTPHFEGQYLLCSFLFWSLAQYRMFNEGVLKKNIEG